jgi:hypothetical protein
VQRLASSARSALEPVMGNRLAEGQGELSKARARDRQRRVAHVGSRERIRFISGYLTDSVRPPGGELGLLARAAPRRK